MANELFDALDAAASPAASPSSQPPQAASPAQGDLFAALDGSAHTPAPAATAQPQGDLFSALDRPASAAPAAGQIPGWIDQYAQQYKIDPKIAHALVHQESNGNHNAVSPKGAMGITQLMPETARGLGVTDPFDPESNIRGGFQYLRQMLDKYHGNYRLALAAYNAGPGNVDKYNDVPPFAETQAYVRNIMAGNPDAQSQQAAVPPPPQPQLDPDELAIYQNYLEKQKQYDETHNQPSALWGPFKDFGKKVQNATGATNPFEAVGLTLADTLPTALHAPATYANALYDKLLAFKDSDYPDWIKNHPIVDNAFELTRGNFASLAGVIGGNHISDVDRQVAQSVGYQQSPETQPTTTAGKFAKGAGEKVAELPGMLGDLSMYPFFVAGAAGTVVRPAVQFAVDSLFAAQMTYGSAEDAVNAYQHAQQNDWQAVGQDVAGSGMNAYFAKHSITGMREQAATMAALGKFEVASRSQFGKGWTQLDDSQKAAVLFNATQFNANDEVSGRRIANGTGMTYADAAMRTGMDAGTVYQDHIGTLDAFARGKYGKGYFDLNDEERGFTSDDAQQFAPQDATAKAIASAHDYASKLPAGEQKRLGQSLDEYQKYAEAVRDDRVMSDFLNQTAQSKYGKDFSDLKPFQAVATLLDAHELAQDSQSLPEEVKSRLQTQSWQFDEMAHKLAEIRDIAPGIVNDVQRQVFEQDAKAILFDQMDARRKASAAKADELIANAADKNDSGDPALLGTPGKILTPLEREAAGLDRRAEEAKRELEYERQRAQEEELSRQQRESAKAAADDAERQRKLKYGVDPEEAVNFQRATADQLAREAWEAADAGDWQRSQEILEAVRERTERREVPVVDGVPGTPDEIANHPDVIEAVNRFRERIAQRAEQKAVETEGRMRRLEKAAQTIEAEAPRQTTPEAVQAAHQDADEAKAAAQRLRQQLEDARRTAAAARNNTHQPVGDTIPMVRGRETAIKIPDGPSYPGHYAAVEQRHLTPSHNPLPISGEWTKNDNAYQPRTSYGNSEAKQLQVIQRGQEPDMSLILSDSPTPSNGPSIVRRDGMVAGGNQRAMIQRLAYDHFRQGDKVKKAVVEQAAKFGIDPAEVEKMQQPVIVRMFSNDHADRAEMYRIGDELNNAEAGSYSEIERGAADAVRLTDEQFESVINTINDRDWSLRDYMRNKPAEVLLLMRDTGILKESQESAFVEEGQLTEAGKRAFTAAVRGKVFGDPELLQVSEHVVPQQLEKLDKALGSLAALKAKGGAWDIMPEVKDSLRLLTDVAKHRDNFNNTIATINNWNKGVHKRGEQPMEEPKSEVDFFLHPDKYRGTTMTLGMVEPPTAHPVTEAIAKFLETPTKEVKAGLQGMAKDAVADEADDSQGGFSFHEPVIYEPWESFNRHIAQPVGMEIPAQDWGTAEPLTPHLEATKAPSMDHATEQKVKAAGLETVGKQDENVIVQVPGEKKPVALTPQEIETTDAATLRDKVERITEQAAPTPQPPADTEPPSLRGVNNPLREGVTVYASGSNRVSEIKGFHQAGVPVGVDVSQLSEKAIGELENTLKNGGRVFLDSGAFGEVKVGKDGKLVDKKPIAAAEWKRRLDIYERLAKIGGERVTVVAPDKVGDQQETLKRLQQFADRLQAIDKLGAKIAIPLQVGDHSAAEFYNEAVGITRVEMVPAMPLNKAAENLHNVVEFVRQVQPAEIHLLGMGATNKSAEALIKALKHTKPDLQITMDSNRIRSVVGENGKFTALEREYKDAPDGGQFTGEVDLREFGGGLHDYTESIYQPSTWATPQQLEEIADGAGLTAAQRNEFLSDPDEFVKVDEGQGVNTQALDHALTEAYTDYVKNEAKGPARTRAIAETFGDSKIGGQYDAPPPSLSAPSGKPENKNEVKARAKRMSQLHASIAAAPHDIADLEGSVRDLQHFLDRSAANEMDPNWWDGLQRMVDTSDLEGVEEELEALHNDPTAWKPYPQGWPGAGPDSKYPTRMTPTEEEYLRESQKMLQDDIAGIKQSVEGAKRELAELQKRGKLPEEIAKKHGLTVDGTPIEKEGALPAPPPPLSNSDVPRGTPETLPPPPAAEPDYAAMWKNAGYDPASPKTLDNNGGGGANYTKEELDEFKRKHGIGQPSAEADTPKHVEQAESLREQLDDLQSQLAESEDKKERAEIKKEIKSLQTELDGLVKQHPELADENDAPQARKGKSEPLDTGWRDYTFEHEQLPNGGVMVRVRRGNELIGEQGLFYPGAGKDKNLGDSYYAERPAKPEDVIRRQNSVAHEIVRDHDIRMMRQQFPDVQSLIDESRHDISEFPTDGSQITATADDYTIPLEDILNRKVAKEPKLDAKMKAALEAKLQQYKAARDEDIARYNEIRNEGLKHISDYDLSISSGGDPVSAWDTALELKANHIRWQSAHLDAVERALQNLNALPRTREEANAIRNERTKAKRAAEEAQAAEPPPAPDSALPPPPTDTITAPPTEPAPKPEVAPQPYSPEAQDKVVPIPPEPARPNSPFAKFMEQVERLPNVTPQMRAAYRAVVEARARFHNMTPDEWLQERGRTSFVYAGDEAPTPRTLKGVFNQEVPPELKQVIESAGGEVVGLHEGYHSLKTFQPTSYIAFNIPQVPTIVGGSVIMGDATLMMEPVDVTPDQVAKAIADAREVFTKAAEKFTKDQEKLAKDGVQGPPTLYQTDGTTMGVWNGKKIHQLRGNDPEAAFHIISHTHERDALRKQSEELLEQRQSGQISHEQFAKQDRALTNQIGKLNERIRAMSERHDAVLNQNAFRDASDKGPVWVLKSEQVTKAKLPNSFSGDQALSTLRAAGVKADELRWLGIDEFLKGKQKVSKEELLQHIAANDLGIQEVTKGGDGADRYVRDANGNPLHDGAGSLVQSFGSPKYAGYKLPGGIHYREMLFTLPLREGGMPAPRGWETADATHNLGNNFTSGHWDEPNVFAHTRVQDFTDKDGNKVLLIDEIQSDWHQQGRKKGYQDNGNAAKEAAEAEKQYAAAQAAVEEVRGRFHAARNAHTAHIKATETTSPELEAKESRIHDEFLAAEKRETEAYLRMAEAKRKFYQQGVPDAPFKKDWHEFVLKRLIRYAAENGYDKIAVTPGKEQASRFNLSTHIASLTYEAPIPDASPEWGRIRDNYILTAKTHDGQVHHLGPKTAEELPDLVGKEVAQKIIAGEGKVSPPAEPDIFGDYSGHAKTLEGLDLHVGGEGMRGFYDKIIPDFLNKFGKRFKVKVGTTELADDRGDRIGSYNVALQALRGGHHLWYQVDEDGERYWTSLESPRDLEERYPDGHIDDGTSFWKTNPETKNYNKVHSLDITPDLRDDVMQGQTLFQHGRNATVKGQIDLRDPNNRVIKAFASADISTLVHETAHLFRQDLTPEELKTAERLFGVSDGNWQRSHEELFARGFERFLYDGTTTVPELKPVFQRFKEWLRGIYQRLVGSPLSNSLFTNPEVRAFYDRMLGGTGEGFAPAAKAKPAVKSDIRSDVKSDAPPPAASSAPETTPVASSKPPADFTQNLTDPSSGNRQESSDSLPPPPPPVKEKQAEPLTQPPVVKQELAPPPAARAAVDHEQRRLAASKLEAAPMGEAVHIEKGDLAGTWKKVDAFGSPMWRNEASGIYRDSDELSAAGYDTIAQGMGQGASTKIFQNNVLFDKADEARARLREKLGKNKPTILFQEDVPPNDRDEDFLSKMGISGDANAEIDPDDRFIDEAKQHLYRFEKMAKELHETVERMKEQRAAEEAQYAHENEFGSPHDPELEKAFGSDIYRLKPNAHPSISKPRQNIHDMVQDYIKANGRKPKSMVDLQLHRDRMADKARAERKAALTSPPPDWMKQMGVSLDAPPKDDDPGILRQEFHTDNEVFNDLVELGGGYYEQGFRNFPVWKNKMREDIGDAFDAQLGDIYDHLVDVAVQRAQERMRTATPAQRKEIERVQKEFQSASGLITTGANDAEPERENPAPQQPVRRSVSQQPGRNVDNGPTQPRDGTVLGPSGQAVSSADDSQRKPVPAATQRPTAGSGSGARGPRGSSVLSPPPDGGAVPNPAPGADAQPRTDEPAVPKKPAVSKSAPPAAKLAAPVRERATALYHPEKWAAIKEAYGIPGNAPAPTRGFNPEIAEVLGIPGQRYVAELMLSALDQHDSAVLASSTGTGKTYMSAAVVAQKLSDVPDARVLVISKNRDIFGDPLKLGSFRNIASDHFNFDIDMLSTSQGPEYFDKPGVYGATYDTLRENKELHNFPWDLVIADESGEARRYYTQESARGAALHDTTLAAKQALFLSATPFHTPAELMYLEKLGLWRDSSFADWAAQFGVRYDSKRGWVNPPNPRRMLALRDQLIERGQFINWDRDMEGFTAHFGVVPMSEAQLTELKNAGRAFDMAFDWFAKNNKRSMQRAVLAVRATFVKNYIERARLPQAIEMARQAEAKGWKPIIFTENMTGRKEVYDFLKPADDAMGGAISRLMPNLPDVADELEKAFPNNIGIYAGPGGAGRTAEMDAFKADIKKHLYSTYAAGGVGVSMHDTEGDKPRFVIYLGLPWSGVMFDQAMGRAWRFGTKSNVESVFLASDNAAEVRLLREKIGPRLKSLKAIVSGLEKEPVSDTMMTALSDYMLGGEDSADLSDFVSRAKTNAVGHWRDIEIGDAKDAMHKGMKYRGAGIDFDDEPPPSGGGRLLNQVELEAPPESPMERVRNENVDRLEARKQGLVQDIDSRISAVRDGNDEDDDLADMDEHPAMQDGSWADDIRGRRGPSKAGQEPPSQKHAREQLAAPGSFLPNSGKDLFMPEWAAATVGKVPVANVVAANLESPIRNVIGLIRTAPSVLRGIPEGNELVNIVVPGEMKKRREIAKTLHEVHNDILGDIKQGSEKAKQVYEALGRAHDPQKELAGQDSLITNAPFPAEVLKAAQRVRDEIYEPLWERAHYVRPEIGKIEQYATIIRQMKKLKFWHPALRGNKLSLEAMQGLPVDVEKLMTPAVKQQYELDRDTPVARDPQSPYLKPRTGDTDRYLDIHEVMEAYVPSVLKVIHDTPIIDKAIVAINNIDRKTQPELDAFAKSYLRNYAGVPDEFRRTFRLWNKLKSTLLRANYAAVTEWNPHLTMLRLGHTIVNGYTELGTKYAALGVKNLFTQGGRELVAQSGALMDLPYEPRAWKRMANGTLRATTYGMEFINRGVAYLGELERQKDQGAFGDPQTVGTLTPERIEQIAAQSPAAAKKVNDALDAAYNAVASTQFMYTPAHEQRLMKEWPVVTQFMSWPTREIGFIRDVMANGKTDPMKAFRLIASASVFSSLIGAPMIHAFWTMNHGVMGWTKDTADILAKLYEGKLTEKQLDHYLEETARSYVPGFNLLVPRKKGRDLTPPPNH